MNLRPVKLAAANDARLDLSGDLRAVEENDCCDDDFHDPVLCLLMSAFCLGSTLVMQDPCQFYGKYSRYCYIKINI